MGACKILSKGRASLFLGDWESAIDAKFILSNKIQCVYNMTNTIPNYFKGYVDYTRVPLSNFHTRKDKRMMKSAIHRIIAQIIRDINNGRTVLVHSVTGNMRAAHVVKAVLNILSKKQVQLSILKSSVFDYGRGDTYT